ncbi:MULTISPECIES: hypothetical protein [unclassified Saccharicrinis]|uniref:hypothetical protein n=1 Tax=unclassified Saccharicrinis TaxID=2646859 RepID=UPI003D35860C
MSRPGEDRLTDMIKHNLDGYEPAYNPEAWNKLNARLNSHVTPVPLIYKPWFLGFASGIIFMVVVYYFWRDYGGIRHTNDNNYVTEELERLKHEIHQLKENDSIHYHQSVRRAMESRMSEVYAKKESGFYEPMITKRYVFIDTQNKESGNKSMYEKEGDLLQKLPSIPSYSNILYILLQDSLPLHQDDFLSERKKTKHKKTFHINWPTISFKQDAYEKFTGPDRIYMSSSLETESNINGIKGLSKSVGIGLSGKISQQMSIHGGINFGLNSGSKKEALWYSQIIEKPDTSYLQLVSDTTVVDSHKWNYLDIPIGINYQVLSNDNHSLDVSLSALSRIFLSEKYTHILDITNKPNVETEKKIDAGENSHLFAKLRLGFKYTYHMNDRWSIAAHPYYSMPLQKYSYLKVKNSGWGANVNLVYKLNKNKD